MYLNNNGLGYLVREGLNRNNFYEYEKLNNGQSLYVLDGVYSERFDFLRILYLSLCAEGLLTQEELSNNIAKYNGTYYSDEGYERETCINDILSLNVFSSRCITDIEEAILFLNQYQVRPIIQKHPEILLSDSFFTEHGCIFYESDESAKIYIGKYVAEGRKGKYSYAEYLEKGESIYDKEYLGHLSEDYRLYEFGQKCPEKNQVYMLDLSMDYASTDYWNYSVRLGEVGDSVIPIYSAEGVNVYIGDCYSHLSIYNLLRKKIIATYSGEIVEHSDTKIILQDKNKLFRVEGSKIKEIYELPKYMMVGDNDPDYAFGEKEIITVKPVIRAYKKPYVISYSGRKIDDLYRIHDYIWDSFIVTECEANNVAPETVSIFTDIYYGLHENVCTISSLTFFYEKMKELDSQFYDKTEKTRRMLDVIGEYVDKDTDLTTTLIIMRRESIYSERDYWDEVIPRVVENRKREIGKIRSGNNDIVTMDKEGIIDYNHRKFLTDQFIDRILKLHEEGKLRDYLM